MGFLDAGDFGLAVGASGQFVIEKLAPICQHRRQRGIRARILCIGGRGSFDHKVAECIEFANRRE